VLTPNETVEKPYFQTELEVDSWSRCTLNGTQRGTDGLGSTPQRLWILPILCTRTNNLYCTSTFNLERTVKRFMRFCTQMLAKTGSTIPSCQSIEFLLHSHPKKKKPEMPQNPHLSATRFVGTLLIFFYLVRTDGYATTAGEQATSAHGKMPSCVI
jgi:hypothetical protein